MSNFNTQHQISYVNSMTSKEKIIFLKILITIANSDKKFKNDERDFIKNMVITFGLPKEAISEILSPMTEDQLFALASQITNRQIALQLLKEACILANSDGDFSDTEILLIGKIGQAMGIELEKIEQISQWIIDKIIWHE